MYKREIERRNGTRKSEERQWGRDTGEETEGKKRHSTHGSGGRQRGEIEGDR
jgi:hypothetical protein